MATKLKNKIIGLKDLRLNTNKYINRLSRGESFTVVKRSKPVFKVVPIDEDDDFFWDTVVDFSDRKEGGIPAEELLKAFKKFENAKSRKIYKKSFKE